MSKCNRFISTVTSSVPEMYNGFKSLVYAAKSMPLNAN